MGSFFSSFPHSVMAKKKAAVKKKKKIKVKEKLAEPEFSYSQDYRIAKGVQVGTTLSVVCNHGVKKLKVFSVMKSPTRLNRLPNCSVGHFVIGSVQKGSSKLKGTIQYALVIRQRKCFRRKNGETISFEDNAAVIVNNKGEMKGSHIGGPLAKEAAVHKT